MEYFIAAVFTFLAAICGWLFIKKHSLKKIQGSEHSMAADDRATNVVTKKGGEQEQDHDEKDMFIDSNEPNSLQSFEGCESPLEVKEFVRYMRDSQFQEMSEEERKEEARIQKEQLSNIFNLMQNCQEQLGINSMEEMEEQMKLYSSSAK